MRVLTTLAIATASTLGTTALAQYGPVAITGTVLENTLVGGRFQTAVPGERVRMTFRTLPGGFNPFWGPTGRFVNIDEPSFEMYVGEGANERVCYSAANNNAILFVNAGYVTDVVHQDEMEFFQMAMDSSLYRVYFKVSDYDDSVWTSPLIGELPHITPSAPFDFKRWEVTDLFNPNMSSSAPKLTIDFDGSITVPCRGDFNADGAVSVQDIFDFLSAYFASATSADVNGDLMVTVQDIFDFLSFYFRGC
jgi:hypothetical protein